MHISMHVIRNELYLCSYLCCEMNFVHQTPRSYYKSYQPSYLLYKTYYIQSTSVSWARRAHEEGVYFLAGFSLNEVA